MNGLITGDVSRVDLHLHSIASGAATNWWVKRLGANEDARESYTQPEEAYRMAQRAGMSFVTLTDHETIEGALTLRHRPDFFIGEEVSTVFPEDGSYVDVLIYGLDEEDHGEIQARRSSVYELVNYLRQAGLVHVLAHPMYGVPGPLHREQVEKRLVLFGIWELVNGSRPAEQNRLAQEISVRTGVLDLRQMAARHGLPAPTHRSILGTGGSDDHGGIYGGATHTITPRIASPEEFLEALTAGEVRPFGENGNAGKLVHTGFKIADGALEEGKDAQSMRALAKLALRLTPLRWLHETSRTSNDGFLEQVPLLARLKEPRIKAELVGRYEERLSGALEGGGSGFPAVDFFGSIGEIIDSHLLLAPYLAVQGYFGRENKRARTLRREMFPSESKKLKSGLFADGIDGIHGVGTLYRNIMRELHGDFHLDLVRCGEEDGAEKNTHSLRPVATLPVPLYDQLELGIPSLLDVVEHVVAEDYDVLHVVAPGPLGLAALVSGLILGIPVVGAYHTEFGAYARALSGDDLVAGVVEVVVREFYERCSAVAVPSQATALALRNRGYRIQHFEVLKNGVDTTLFNPERRDPSLRDSLGGGKTLLLYVGRVSKEKELERLARDYLELQRCRDDVHLVITGDGPYREELEDMLGETATFTGFLKGQELARMFASCDIFVFPSTTDTLGRAVLEAQASGLPAVVYGTGGPRECIRPGISGFVVDNEDEKSFLSCVEFLLRNPESRARMGSAGWAFAECLSWRSVVDGLAAFHARVAGIEDDQVRTR